MEPLVKSGEVSLANYAYLFDRIAVGADRPQRYGTQGRCTGPELWEPNTLENEVSVEALRQEARLGPLSDYKERMSRYCADFTA